jgi:hypothetical protein
MLVQNQIRFRAWFPVGRNKKYITELVKYYKDKYNLKDNEVGIIPQVDIDYHIQLISNENSVNAYLFLKGLKEEGMEKNDLLLINAYIFETEENGKKLYKVRLPTEFKKIPERILVNSILNRYQVIRDYNITDAFPVIPELVRDAETTTDQYKEFKKKKEDKVAEEVKKEAIKQVQKRIAKIEQAPLTWDGDINSLMESAVKFIQRKYRVFSGKILPEENAKNYISWVAKYTDLYDVNFLDMLSILIHESRFYERTGDAYNKIKGILNPSEGFIQMGRATQVEVYAGMRKDYKKNPKKYPVPKAERNIKKELPELWKHYQYLKIGDYIPNIKNNPELQIRFASKLFQMCGGDVGKYNEGVYAKKGDEDYADRVEEETKELLKFKRRYIN